MHPLEQLRYVARGWENGDQFPAQEVAAVLAELAETNPASLLQACRRLIEYFPSSGVAWWLSARVLAAADPVERIWETVDELDNDPTGRMLAQALPVSGAVAVPEPSYAVMGALRRRKDLALQKKVGGADIVVVTAMAAGPAAVMVGARAGTAATTAGRAGKTVWAVLERGVVLPGPLWDQLLDRSEAATLATLPVADIGVGVGDQGTVPAAELLSAPTCPPVAELLGWGTKAGRPLS